MSKEVNHVLRGPQRDADLNQVLKGLQQYADPPSSFDVRCLKSFKVSMTLFKREDMVRVVERLRKFADPPTSFSIIENNHYKVSWDMTNDDGERVTVRKTIGPNFEKNTSWKDAHKEQLQLRFEELNISTEVTHI